MKAAETTVLNLLQGSKVFLIPNFQRRYAWRRLQWEELWEDLLREYEMNRDGSGQNLDGHFLGSVVLHPAPGRPSTMMRHLVVDGQQRLTTLLVLMAAIRDVRAFHEPTWNTNAYDAKYITNPYDEDYPDRLVPTEFDRVPYVETIRHGNPTGGIGQAYTFFKDAIEAAIVDAGIDLARLGDVLLMNMLLVEINTSAGDSVNNIFNTLNSKGLPLSATDLIRNELLLNLDEGTANSVYRETWLPMEEALVRVDSKGGTNDARFVTFFWAREVAHAHLVTKKNLFQYFERRFRKRMSQLEPSRREAEVLRYFSELWRDYEIYRYMSDPYGYVPDDFERTPELDEVLRQLRQWGAEPYVPIALWVLQEVAVGKTSTEDAAAALRALLGYLVRRALAGLPTNNLNRMLSPIPSTLRSRPADQPAASSLIEILRRPNNRWPGDAEIRSALVSQPLFYSVKRNQTKFLLATVEAVRSGDVPPHGTSAYIQHIMPATLGGTWMAQFSSLDVDIDEAEASTNVIGNLTLAYDPPFDPPSFAEIKAELSGSPLSISREVAAAAIWTPREIAARSRLMADALVEVFEGPGRDFSISGLNKDSADRMSERITSILQALPEGHWTTEDELVQLLAIESEQIRGAISNLPPVLSRLVRTANGGVPAWLPIAMQTEVRKQDSAEPRNTDAGFMSANDVADILGVELNDSLSGAFDDSAV